MKCKKKCGLSFASTLRAAELLTTSPSKGPPEQVCRGRGGGSMDCEHHQGGAVPGKMQIGSSIQHCPRPGMKRCFLSCHRTEGLCAWPPFFLKLSLPLSVPLCSLPSLPPAVGVLPTLQPPHSSSLCFQPLIPRSLPTPQWQQLPSFLYLPTRDFTSCFLAL